MAAARLGGVVPEAVTLAMSVVNRLLPGPMAEGARRQRGAEVRGLETAPASRIGRAAAERYNQTA